MEVFVIVSAVLLGACLGSFANVCIWRLPRPGLSPAAPARSRCPRCGARLAWFDNVPVASWCLLGGVCRRCGGRIAFRYTLVEVLTAALAAAIAAEFVLPAGGEWNPAWAAFLFWLAVAWGLLVAACIDLELMLLPDEIVLPLLAVAPWFFMLSDSPFGPGQDTLGGALLEAAAAALGGGLGLGPKAAAAATVLGGAAAGLLCGEWGRRRTAWESRGHFLWSGVSVYMFAAAAGAACAALAAAPHSAARFPGPAGFAALVGAGAGAGITGLIRVLGRRAFAQEAMGFGDVKLMALLGALAGQGGILWTLALASLLGAAIGAAKYVFTRERQLPFGPFLIAGAAAAVLGRRELGLFLEWYKNLLAMG